MRHLLTALLIAGSSLPTMPALADDSAAAPKLPLELSARIAMLGIQTGATTRAPSLEMTLGGRWDALPGWGAALSYRGALRNAGGDMVKIRTTHHRFQLGLIAEVAGERLFMGAELGMHALLASTRLSATEGPGKHLSAWSWGPSLEIFAGLRLTEKVRATVQLGGYGRAELIDLIMGLGLGYSPSP